jgi:hypothetical protein
MEYCFFAYGFTRLFFMLAGGAVFAAHAESGGAAVDTFVRAMPLDIFLVGFWRHPLP